MNPKVSIIVPVYNVEKYLPRCLDSLISQTYTNLEIILVDDGSMDKCPNICDNYAKSDNRIMVIHKKNGGLSDARNTGFLKSCGEYVCFVDSDDFVASNYVEHLLDICLDYNCDIAICEFYTTSENKVSIVQEKTRCQIYSGIDIISKLYSDEYLNTVVAWNKMYKREIIMGIKYPKNLLYEDEATTCQLLFRANKVGLSNQKLYFYFIRKNSITNSIFNEKKLTDKLIALKKRMNFLKSKELMNYYSLDNLRYLKQISINFFEAKNIPDRSNYRKKMIKLFRKEYYKADKSCWNFKNKFCMVICWCVPGSQGLWQKIKLYVKK